MNLTDTNFGKIVLVLYLSIFAYQDFKTKHIDLRICFGFYAVFSLAYLYFAGKGYEFDCVKILLGLIPAGIIFVLSKMTHSSIGTGDGYFFLGLGFGLGITKVSEVIFYSVLGMAFASLFIVLYCIFSNQSGRKKSIPVIPYVFLPGIAVILC